MSKEIMQQALDALENDAMQRTFAGGVRISNAAIALRAALAEPAAPQPQPVAWRFQSSVGGWAYGSQPPLGSKYPSYPLYAAPPQRPPVKKLLPRKLPEDNDD